jgi:hypothetical protein
MTVDQTTLETRRRLLHAEDVDVPNANGNGANGNGRPRRLPTIGGRVVEPNEISAEVEEMGAEEAIAWAIENFGSSLGFAVSFQKTSSVIIDMAHRIDPSVRFFYLDTELLFPETHDTREALAARYGIEFERFVQDNPPRLRERWEAGEWGEGDDCCAMRKVDTMRRALEGTDCWVSGVRRVDSRRRLPVRLGYPLRPLEAQSARRLGRQNGLELHQGPSRPVQPAPRPGLPLDRLHAVHHEARAGRGPARRPLGRHRPDRVRAQRLTR